MIIFLSKYQHQNIISGDNILPLIVLLLAANNVAANSFSEFPANSRQVISYHLLAATRILTLILIFLCISVHF
jgi:predicted RNase H-like nuclease